jgi:hypothetical protein
MRSMLPRKAASVRMRAPVMRRSWKMWLSAPGERNRKLAHLFMICSNIKLRWPRESIEFRVKFFVNGIKGLR